MKAKIFCIFALLICIQSNLQSTHTRNKRQINKNLERILNHLSYQKGLTQEASQDLNASLAKRNKLQERISTLEIKNENLNIEIEKSWNWICCPRSRASIEKQSIKKSLAAAYQEEQAVNCIIENKRNEYSKQQATEQDIQKALNPFLNLLNLGKPCNKDQLFKILQRLDKAQKRRSEHASTK